MLFCILLLEFYLDKERRESIITICSIGQRESPGIWCHWISEARINEEQDT